MPSNPVATVSIEQAVSKAIAQALNEIRREHGLMVIEVRAEWNMAGKVCCVEMTTKANIKQGHAP